MLEWRSKRILLDDKPNLFRVLSQNYANVYWLAASWLLDSFNSDIGMLSEYNFIYDMQKVSET